MENLITEINTEIKLKEAFAEFLGMDLADIPAELIAEAMGGALGLSGPGERLSAAQGRASEMDWVQDMQARKDKAQDRPSTFRDPRKGGEPTMNRQPEGEDPKAGDFVVVGGKPVKIVDTKTMFGNSKFAYLQGVKSPVMMDRLALAKRVGKVNVFNLAK